MSYTDTLERELAGRGVRAATRRRIVIEITDHLDSDPAAAPGRLGAPAELAQQFAAELATDEARRTARDTFAALALAAIALILGQALIPAAGGYPGYDHGHSLVVAVPALLAEFWGPQIALVAGVLAAARAFRLRRAAALPDAEVALIHRRSLVGAIAGLITCLGMLAVALNFSGQMASWWVAVEVSLAGIAAIALAYAINESRRGRVVAGGTLGEAGDLFADLPELPLLQRLRVLQRHPLAAASAATALILLTTTSATGDGERSLVEGLERGGFEAVFAIGALTVAWLTVRRRGNRAP